MPTRCTQCNEEIDHLNYTAEYSAWGSCYGTANLNGEDCEEEERNPSDDETNEICYECPNCNCSINPDEGDDLRDDDDDDEDEDCDEDPPDHYGYYPNNNEEDEEEDENGSITDEGIKLKHNESGRTERGDQIIGETMEKIPEDDYFECEECHHITFISGDNSCECENCSHLQD